MLGLDTASTDVDCSFIEETAPGSWTGQLRFASDGLVAEGSTASSACALDW